MKVDTRACRSGSARSTDSTIPSKSSSQCRLSEGLLEQCGCSPRSDFALGTPSVPSTVRLTFSNGAGQSGRKRTALAGSRSRKIPDSIRLFGRGRERPECSAPRLWNTQFGLRGLALSGLMIHSLELGRRPLSERAV